MVSRSRNWPPHTREQIQNKNPISFGGGKKTTSDHEPFNKNILFGELTLSTRDDPQHDRLLSCSLSKFEVQDENTIT